jgi:hypothetical protein
MKAGVQNVSCMIHQEFYGILVRFINDIITADLVFENIINLEI